MALWFHYGECEPLGRTETIICDQVMSCSGIKKMPDRKLTSENIFPFQCLTLRNEVAITIMFSILQKSVSMAIPVNCYR